MVAMLSVEKQKIIRKSLDATRTLHKQSGFDINPTLKGGAASYVKQMNEAGIDGIRQTAIEIIKERLCKSK